MSYRISDVVFTTLNDTLKAEAELIESLLKEDYQDVWFAVKSFNNQVELILEIDVEGAGEFVLWDLSLQADTPLLVKRIFNHLKVNNEAERFKSLLNKKGLELWNKG